jgi:glucan phosphoethanolaminetransferase (alkaline phosphatase superfamily)
MINLVDRHSCLCSFPSGNSLFLPSRLSKVFASKIELETKIIHRMKIIEKLYIISSVPLVAFVQIWSKVLLPSLPFLPLLVQSIYTAFGVIYSFILINLELFSVDVKKQQ